MLRESEQREPAAAEGSAGAEGHQVSASTLYAPAGGHPHHVPLL